LHVLINTKTTKEEGERIREFFKNNSLEFEVITHKAFNQNNGWCLYLV
jgi:hypothetical protein